MAAEGTPLCAPAVILKVSVWFRKAAKCLRTGRAKMYMTQGNWPPDMVEYSCVAL